MRKLNEVELEREELFTKVDESNQTTGALRFENNLLVEKTKKQDAELFQVQAQLERTSSSKLDEMLNFQKFASNKIILGYDHSLSSCSTSSIVLNRVIFVLPANNDNFEVTKPKIENVSEDRSDKVKSILGAPPKVGEKEMKQNNHRSSNKMSQPKQPHFCHYCGASWHTCPNCYKCFATQQSNSVSSLGNQNQCQLSLAPLGEPLKAIMLHSNLNGFNSPSYPSE